MVESSTGAWEQPSSFSVSNDAANQYDNSNGPMFKRQQTGPEYNREKYLAEEFRRGGDVPTGGQSRSSQVELNKFLNKIKNEINGAGAGKAITDSPSFAAQPKTTSIIPKVLLAKVSPLEQQLSQMKESGNDAPSLISNKRSVIPTSSIVSDALREHTDSMRKDSVLKNSNNPGTSRI